MSKASGLIEKMRAATAEAKRRKGPQCTICGLPEEIKQFINDERLRIPPSSFPQIVAGLSVAGYSLRPEIVARHFRQHDQ